MMIGGTQPLRRDAVHPSQRPPRYTKREPSWRLVHRRGDTVRSYGVRPVLIGSTAAVLVVLLTAYVGATAYLIYRDDILGAAVSRQVKLQYSYEERIAALRSELDRVTSRHAVQTLGVEQQVAVLLNQQEAIERRQRTLDSLVQDARSAGLPIAQNLGDGSAAAAPPASASLAYAPAEASASDPIARTLFGRAPQPAAADGARSVRPVLAAVGASLDDAEARQRTALDSLDAAASKEAERLSGILRPLGANVGGPEQEAEPEGGPYIPPRLHFVERAALLKRSLGDIVRLRSAAGALPLGQPVQALTTSSGFGNRVDPFLKRPAFHSGLDFVAASGSTVRATAPGTVTIAGENGGYGMMVEIQHANGISTRYGHLSAIAVAKGMPVKAGQVIGAVGSTGRSTGPHLHYETRVDDEPVNPLPYLAAGRALRNG